jgi:hypothetical protein
MKLLIPFYQRKVVKKRTPLGFKEGFSKTLSYSFGYGIDSRKVLYQFHGYIPKLDKNILIKRWTTGLGSCALSVGFINYIYFAVYHRFIETPFAGVLAALATIFIKVPIYNSMKILQSARTDNLIDGMKFLAKTKGLYTGIPLTLLEDTIELDIKNRLYNKFKQERNVAYNVMVGTFSSAFAAAVTIPFDNLRLRMLDNTLKQPLYKGVGFRVLSNITKNLSFFIIFELTKLYFL